MVTNSVTTEQATAGSSGGEGVACTTGSLGAAKERPHVHRPHVGTPNGRAKATQGGAKAPKVRSQGTT